MPYDDPDPRDPNLLVGVSVPGDRDSLRQMAVTFAEEFAALGFGEAKLLRLFRSPAYTAAHRAYRALGETEIRRIVQQSLELPFRVVVRDAPEAQGPEPLVALRPPRGKS